MTQTEALKLAFEALDNLMYWDNGKPDYDEAREAITAIKEALAQTDEKKSALSLYESGFIDGKEKGLKEAQRTWVGLTEEEINKVLGGDIHDEPNGLLEFVRAIEAKLKEKNT